MNNAVKTALKRQVPFLIGGTITGIVMTYFFGFLVTLLVNSFSWYVISYIIYNMVWKKNSLSDQKILLRFFVSRIKPKQEARL